MTKIDIENAYDDFTQETLFTNIIKDSLDESTDYDTDELQKNSVVLLLSNDSIYNFSEKLKELYQFSNQKRLAKLSAIDRELTMYMTVDYSAMLRDDLMNGFIVLIHTPENQYYAVIREQANKQSNITAKKSITSFLFDLQGDGSICLLH